MRRRRRSELFPPDRGLQARMVLAIVLTPAVALGGIVAVVLLASTRTTLGVLFALVVGLCTLVSGPERPAPDPILAKEWPALDPIVERLCVLADLPKPVIVVEPDARPNSWTVCPSGRPSRLHLTSGLLLLLPSDELEAVIAHELAHLAHHDAAVLSLVGGVSSLLIDGAERTLRKQWWFLVLGVFVAYLLGWVSRLGALFLSRGREFAADAGSAALTRRPAALASALRRLTGELERFPQRDLRVAGGREMLGLLPITRPTECPRLTATHPDVAKRIARLEHLERKMHAARLATPRS